jgi:hypothetical protein
VSHIDPEVLALIALGEEAEGPDARAHLARCPHCAHELRALVSVVTVAQQAGDSGALESPPPALWSRVAAHPDVRAGQGPTMAGGHEPGPEPCGAADLPGAARPPRRWWALSRA